MKKCKVLIVGAGIAGLSMALELKRKGESDFIIVSKGKIYQNNTAIAPANSRVIFENEEAKKQVNIMCEKFGSIKENIESIYKKSDYVLDFYRKLGIPFEKSEFGVIPEGGGRAVIKAITTEVDNIFYGVELNAVKKLNTTYMAITSIGEVEAKYIIFATGGYAWKQNINDNVSLRNERILEIIRLLGGEIAGMKNIMYHPFGIKLMNGRRILTSKVVKYMDYIEKEKICFNKYLIKENQYHLYINDIANEMRESSYILNFKQDVIEKVKKNLEKSNLPNILEGKQIKIIPTAHYFAGGVIVDKEFKVKNCKNIYALGEFVYDGKARLPGHAFTSAIIGSKICVESIV